MRRNTGILVVVCMICLFFPACKQKETRENSGETASNTANLRTVSKSAGTGAVAETVSSASGAKVASIPAFLFRIPDKKIMNESYSYFRDRMLGDLESELKWQEKLENLANTASGTTKK